MRGYIYILSNKSMPGLIKIGMTTNSPSHRMSQLHSTGVPTPFELEFAAEVENCQLCERNSHNALQNYRVASNREFFKTSIQDAIVRILPVLGSYKIFSIKNTYGISEIEASVERRRRETLEAAQEREKIRTKEKQKQADEKAQKIFRLQAQLKEEHHKLALLGKRPVQHENNLIQSFLFLCFFPIPIGWLVWIMALKIFSAKHETAGFVAIALIIGGLIVYIDNRGKENSFSKLIKPFYPVEEKIRNLEKAIRVEGGTPTPPISLEESKGMLKDFYKKDYPGVEKVSISCPECVKPMRVPSNKHLNVICPHCKIDFKIKT